MPETAAEMAERIAVVLENQATLAIEFFGAPRSSARVQVFRYCARLAREAGRGEHVGVSNDYGQLEDRLERIRALLTSGPIGVVSGERYIRADRIRDALDGELPSPQESQPTVADGPPPERA
jgi:hypothetical protein